MDRRSPLSITPLPPTREGAKRGSRILRGQSYQRINNEILLRLLTVLARKGDLKISLTGAPQSRCLSNPCREFKK